MQLCVNNFEVTVNTCKCTDVFTTRDQSGGIYNSYITDGQGFMAVSKKNLVLGPCPQTWSVYCHKSLAPWPLESGWLSTLNPRLSRYLLHNCNDHLTNFFSNQFTTLYGDQTNLPPFMLTNRVANKFITIATEINVKKVSIMAQRYQSSTNSRQFSLSSQFNPVLVSYTMHLTIYGSQWGSLAAVRSL